MIVSPAEGPKGRVECLEGPWVAVLHGVLVFLAEDLECDPVVDVRHLDHGVRHGAGGVEHPGILGIFEPQRDHVVLEVGGAVDDGAVDACGGEVEFMKAVVDEQFEAVAVFLAASQGLFESGPVVGTGVVGEVGLGLGLGPGDEVGGHLSASLAAEAREAGVGVFGDRGCSADGGAILPVLDLLAPAVVGAGGGEVVNRVGAGGVHAGASGADAEAHDGEEGDSEELFVAHEEIKPPTGPGVCEAVHRSGAFFARSGFFRPKGPFPASLRGGAGFWRYAVRRPPGG